MKQTWKKIVVFMLAVICTFAMTACGKEETEAFQNITQEMVDTQCIPAAEGLTQSLASLTEEDLAFLTSNENRDDFSRGVTQEWTSKMDELGAFKSAESAEAEINHEKEQVSVHVPAKFEKGNGVVTFVFNYVKAQDVMMPAYMTVMAEETFASNMKGAGINTVMGVGIVFLILIFLIFVISLFKYVNVIGDKIAKKEAPAAKTAPAAAAPKAAPVVEEDLTDDLELVAVISAAIAASENTSTDSFVVRSIKKVNRNKWQRA